MTQNDSTIKSERPAALAYNGKACKFLRKVEQGDSAFVGASPQAVVLIDAVGRDLVNADPDGKCELYFYADEVVVDKTADKSAAKAADDAAWNDANTLNSVAGFDNYLAKYPAGLHAAEAKTRRAGLAG